MYSLQELGNKNLSQIKAEFSTTPIPSNNKIAVNLSENHLQEKTTAELLEIFSALPPHVTILLLDGNDLEKRSTVEKMHILNSIPPTVLDIHLSSENKLAAKAQFNSSHLSDSEKILTEAKSKAWRFEQLCAQEKAIIAYTFSIEYLAKLSQEISPHLLTIADSQRKNFEQGIFWLEIASILGCEEAKALKDKLFSDGVYSRIGVTLQGKEQFIFPRTVPITERDKRVAESIAAELQYYQMENPKAFSEELLMKKDELEIANTPVNELRKKLLNQIGKYPSLENEYGVRQLDEEALTILKQGCSTPTKGEAPKYYREQFIEYICNLLENNKFPKYTFEGEDIRKTRPEEAAIELKKLLGEDGFTLFLLAMQEERQSPEFMEAVFNKATTNEPGKPFERAPVMFIGGPSSSGKTHAANALIKEISAVMGGGLYVRADGADARELCQTIIAALELASFAGYPGIHDLHEHSTALKEVKFLVQDAAYANTKQNFAIIRPETFADWWFTSEQTDFMKLVANNKNKKLIFALVEGADEAIFQEIVAYMGEMRAWVRDNFPTNLEVFDLNGTEWIKESKKYGSWGFTFGLKGSYEACKFYIDLLKEKGESPYTYFIKNDLILLKPTGRRAEWIPAGPTDKGVLLISNQIYQEWLTQARLPEGTMNFNRPNLIDFKKNNPAKPIIFKNLALKAVEQMQMRMTGECRALACQIRKANIRPDVEAFIRIYENPKSFTFLFPTKEEAEFALNGTNITIELTDNGWMAVASHWEFNELYIKFVINDKSSSLYTMDKAMAVQFLMEYIEKIKKTQYPISINIFSSIKDNHLIAVNNAILEVTRPELFTFNQNEVDFLHEKGTHVKIMASNEFKNWFNKDVGQCIQVGEFQIFKLDKNTICFNMQKDGPGIQIKIGNNTVWACNNRAADYKFNSDRIGGNQYLVDQLLILNKALLEKFSEEQNNEQCSIQ
jgi:hypothetical protein